MEATCGSKPTHLTVLPLSERHRETLEVESAISPDIIAGRGYGTIRSRAEVPQVFKKYQLRAPALLVPMYSPDGTSTLYQIRPDNPRRNKKGKPIKYETPGGAEVIADIHPHMTAAVKDTAQPLFITEGVKCGDSLSSRGAATISITGVWMAQRDGKLLPCFDHIPLKGRKVFVVFDSDVMTKDEVQQALTQLVGLLEDKSADVYVIYLPNAEDGSKQGVDDYLATGGTLSQLKALATRFEPKSLARIRLSSDEKLAAAIGELWRIREAMPKVKQVENTRCSVMRSLITAAQEHGKVVSDGVRLKQSIRQIAAESAVSYEATRKALLYLEEAGYLRRDNTRRKKEEASSFILLCDIRHSRANSSQYGEGRSGQEGSQGCQAKDGHGDYPTRTLSDADTYAAYDRGDYHLRPPEQVPELRWSYVEKQASTMKVGMDGKAMRTIEYQYRERLGKKRGGIVEVLVKNDHSASVSELMEDFAGARSRRRDFIRRNITPLVEAGVVELAGDTVTLTDDWCEALENARTLAGEQQQAELQRQRYRRQSKGYRDRHKVKPEPVPDPPQVDDMSKPWPYHPEHCACRECESIHGKVIGEHVDGCYCSECRAWRDGKTPKPRRTSLRLVAPPEEPLVPRELEPTLAQAPEPPNSERPGWHDHPILCECDGCLYPEPKYARPWKP